MKRLGDITLDEMFKECQSVDTCRDCELHRVFLTCDFYLLIQEEKDLDKKVDID